MPNRFQINTHDMAYRFLVARDGEHCLACGKAPPKVELEIDHLDNNPKNWDPDNLHLLCRLCNLNLRYKSLAEHRRFIRNYGAKNVCVREREIGIESTHIVKEMVDYRRGSAEMKANSYFEMRFIQWALGEITRQGSLPRKELINSGATVAGCSPITAGRYLDKLTCSLGPLQEIKDPMGDVAVCFRERPKSKTNRREKKLS